MSKALNDQNFQGLIATVDCISHNEKIFGIALLTKAPALGELLEKWPNELRKYSFTGMD